VFSDGRLLVADVVLITGVSRYLSGLFASRLSEDPAISRIIGVDVVPPTHPIGRAEFIRADIRGPMLGRVIAQSGVDTVVHMNVIATPTKAGGRVTQKETNVIGTMQLLAACQKAPSVKRLVVKSSAAVYGSSSRDPAMFTEDMGPKVMPRSGFGKDSVEVEGYVRGFSRRRPDVDITMLRLANVIGPGIRTPMTDYFSLPVIPVPFGFDARLQFIHESDAVEAMYLAAVSPMVGIVNVSGDGVVTVLQAAALARRPVAFVPMFGSGVLGNLVKRAGLADFSPDQLQLLAHGRGLDTTRMRQELKFEPTMTTREAFMTFAESLPAVIPGAEEAFDAVLHMAASGASLVGEVVGKVTNAWRPGGSTKRSLMPTPYGPAASSEPMTPHDPSARESKPVFVQPGEHPRRPPRRAIAAAAQEHHRSSAGARRDRPALRVVEGEDR
jgi:UDP-glucose 4-epimerase